MPVCGAGDIRDGGGHALDVWGYLLVPGGDGVAAEVWGLAKHIQHRRVCASISLGK